MMLLNGSKCFLEKGLALKLCVIRFEISTIHHCVVVYGQPSLLHIVAELVLHLLACLCVQV